MVRQPDATMKPAPQDHQLMSKHRVLSFKPQLRLERRGQDGQNETEQPDHSASLGDSITSSTRIRFSVHTGVSCDAKPQNLSSAVPHDQQSIEQAKRDRRHDEQIHRRDAVGMVMKERLPALRRWASSFDHILGHARLSDVDAELEQLSVDPRRSPWRVGNANLSDQLAYLQRNNCSG